MRKNKKGVSLITLVVTIIVMIMGGTNFLMYYFISKGKWRNVHKDIEVKYMNIVKNIK